MVAMLCFNDHGFYDPFLMIYSSPVVQMKPDNEVKPTKYRFYSCGWLSAKSSWLLLTYVDDENPTGAARSDLLIAPSEIGPLLDGLDIRAAALMRPENEGAKLGWSFERVSEIWVDLRTTQQSALFVTETGEHWYATDSSAALGMLELERVYPHKSCDEPCVD
jgi:hypothetical protein